MPAVFGTGEEAGMQAQTLNIIWTICQSPSTRLAGVLFTIEIPIRDEKNRSFALVASFKHEQW